MLVKNLSSYPINSYSPPNINQPAINTALQQSQLNQQTFMASPSADLLQAYYTPTNVQVPKTITKSVWATATPEKKQNIFQMGEHYKAFLNDSKTDTRTVDKIIERVHQEGFQPWPSNQPNRLFAPGEKFYRVNRDRTIHLIVIGQEPLSNGFKMVASHIDSPHISLKAKPLQDAPGEFAVFKTRVHGGLKSHQWTQIPLALVGKAVRKDGSVVKVDIGNKPTDPVFIIPELAPHVDGKGDNKVPLENLNAIAGCHEAYSLDPNTEGKVSDNIEKILYSHYGITKDDFENAQLDLVPAMNARDVGFDRSMITGYGQDDKTSVYASTEALINALKYNPVPVKTIIASNFGNEEIGSWNSYGAKSDDTRTTLAEIMKYTTGIYDEFALKQGFKNSLIVSADVTTAIDPVDPSAEESSNSSKLGYGPAISKEGHLTSTPEAAAFFKHLIGNVQTQTHTFNQDKGGGGTLGNYVATQNNADVVDVGVPVIGMHSPSEVVSKADLYELTTALMNYYSS